MVKALASDNKRSIHLAFWRELPFVVGVLGPDMLMRVNDKDMP